jgi:hypothetical protein
VAERGPYLVTRLVAAVMALAVALAVLFAMGAFWHLKPGSLDMKDVLIGPFMVVFWVAPPLFVVAMASRAKNALSAALPLVLAVMMLVALQLFHSLPWHYGHWHDHLGDASFQLFIVVMLGFWPLVAAGGLLWLALNRR